MTLYYLLQRTYSFSSNRENTGGLPLSVKDLVKSISPSASKDNCKIFSKTKNNVVQPNVLGKGKGMSHIQTVRWGVPVRETLVLSHQFCEVGWPVPFLTTFISPVFPPGTHLLLGGQ